MKKSVHFFCLTCFLILMGLTIVSCDKDSSQELESKKIKNKDTSDSIDDVNSSKEELETNNKSETKDDKDRSESSEAKDNQEQENEYDEIQKPIRDIRSMELVEEIKIGWNLGNTMDATGGAGNAAEISWGNPITKKEMIDVVKEAGFNIVRIPTTWDKHFAEAPDYTINKMWLDRVQEIVDYAIDNDMFVILNMHHEEWHFPSYDNFDTASEILEKLWIQIAERFKNYDEHLIFEGMNEPRLKGTQYEWNGGTPEGRDVVNKLNAVFVETIRNSGGNNPLRHLMIPTYAASSDTRTWKDFIVPEDDKVIVSIHAYTPYNFALNKTGTSSWSVENISDTQEMDNLMENIYNYFIKNEIPVIIGEFGAMNKDNLESRVAWSEYYVKKATEKGIPCIWWDNGAFHGSGENFGLLKRRDLEWMYPEIIEALMRGLEG
jgi:endoglucanase